MRTRGGASISGIVPSSSKQEGEALEGWASGSEKNSENARAFLRRINGASRSLSNAISVAYMGFAKQSYSNPPPVPAFINTIYADIETAKLLARAGAAQGSRAAPRLVALPPALISAYEGAQPEQVEHLEQFLVKHGDNCIDAITALCNWHQNHNNYAGSAGDKVVQRILDGEPTAPNLAGSLFLADLEAISVAPPFLPAWVKQVHTFHTDTATAFRNKFPHVDVYCMQTLDATLQYNGEGLNLFNFWWCANGTKKDSVGYPCGVRDEYFRLLRGREDQARFKAQIN